TTTTTTTKGSTQRVPGKFTNVADISWIKQQKVVALSFDDGPFNNGNPQRIHSALNKAGFHATFFYWGQHIQGNENEIKQAEQSGFEVANHTWSHPDNWGNMDRNSVRSQYNQCKQALDKIVGEDRVYLLRNPYLQVSGNITGELSEVPMPNSGIDSEDWNGNSTSGIVQRIQQAAQQGRLDGQVVLMHENYDSTASAVEQLCQWLPQNGYAVVTVSEMFKFHNKELKGGKVYNSCWD
ncbi:MAG: polysaccharide deacetylase family protein, partial [Oscillospiraceae bacterium]|nr:polysaccharide deacetylase family protein [Oscillospiraceae bacterium]